MSSGENTRNYYRNQGMAIERERIIKLLEDKKIILEAIDTSHNQGSEINSIRTKTIGSVIQLIKGENNA